MEAQTLIKAEQMRFVEAMPGVSKVNLWGDPEGSHGSLTRFKAGFTTPLHSHTHEVRMVVISGTLVHTDAGQVTNLGPGSYCFIPGGKKHVTACTPDSDCLFYEEQPGQFDLIPVQ
jgi:quercetin dioxygenase-like cupin family protein